MRGAPSTESGSTTSDDSCSLVGMPSCHASRKSSRARRRLRQGVKGSRGAVPYTACDWLSERPTRARAPTQTPRTVRMVAYTPTLAVAQVSQARNTLRPASKVATPVAMPAPAAVSRAAKVNPSGIRVLLTVHEGAHQRPIGIEQPDGRSWVVGGAAGVAGEDGVHDIQEQRVGHPHDGHVLTHAGRHGLIAVKDAQRLLGGLADGHDRVMDGVGIVRQGLEVKDAHGAIQGRDARADVI